MRYYIKPNLMSKFLTLIAFWIFIVSSCKGKSDNSDQDTRLSDVKQSIAKQEIEPNVAFDTLTKTIHVFVALCDNKYQGIVPVPASIGNGQDPDSNLYWGCGYGIRTYFKKSKDWKLLNTTKVGDTILERLIFKHTTKDFYIVADAYDGEFIKKCTQDFLAASAGKNKRSINAGNINIGINGNASLVAYIGHDGLMNFNIDEEYINTDKKQRDVIILACYSKLYFSEHLDKANVNPLLWTTHLMCPEAYTLHDALEGYIAGESNIEIRSRGAKAYNKYQKCGEKAARNLLVTGW